MATSYFTLRVIPFLILRLLSYPVEKSNAGNHVWQAVNIYSWNENQFAAAHSRISIQSVGQAEELWQK